MDCPPISFITLQFDSNYKIQQGTILLGFKKCIRKINTTHPTHTQTLCVWVSYKLQKRHSLKDIAKTPGKITIKYKYSNNKDLGIAEKWINNYRYSPAHERTCSEHLTASQIGYM